MGGVCGKKLVLVHQFQTCVGVVAKGQIDGGFEQITVLAGLVDFFVFASPHQRGRPISLWQRTVLLDGSRLAALVPGLKRLGMLQAAVTVLCGPVAGGRDAYSSCPGVERSQLYAPSLLVGLAAIESRSLQLDPVKSHATGDHAKASMGGILQVMAERCGGQL